MGIDCDAEEDNILLIWPTTLVHPIDEESPFYNMSAKDFYRKHYEIIVVMEGIVEPTGMTIQTRSSYLGDEILWGYRFVNVLHFIKGSYQIDYSAFDQVEKVNTQNTSAKHQIEASQKPPRSREQRRNSRRLKIDGSTKENANKLRSRPIASLATLPSSMHISFDEQFL